MRAQRSPPRLDAIVLGPALFCFESVGKSVKTAYQCEPRSVPSVRKHRYRIEPMPNPLDPEAIKLVNKALEVLKERKVTNDYCPRCGVFDWSVDPIAIGVIPLLGIPAHLPNSYFPEQIMALQIVCKNCGYTMLHNLNVLGLSGTSNR